MCGMKKQGKERRERNKIGEKKQRYCKKVKVKASHTRHRALGPELIPVYRQSARR